jgi:hypothetical protein
MLDHWIIIQAGRENGTNGITEQSRREIQRLRSEILSGITKDPWDIAVYYTPSKRGEATSRILVGNRCTRTRVKELWTDTDRPRELKPSIVEAHQRIMDMEINAGTSIIITDYEGTSSYPRVLSNDVFGKGLTFGNLKHGEAYWLDVEREEWRRLPANERLYHSEKIIVKG